METTKQLAEVLLAERLIPLHDVPAIVPPARSGRPLHRSAIWRWVTKGLPGPVGQRVRLEAVRVGRRWVTSHEALARFFAGLTPDARQHEAASRLPARSSLRESTVATLARHGIAVA